MSDSVDRVFVHALNTVKRIPRTGSARPPPASRLKLYGLYKQSTEGDVEGVMKRPRGDGEEIKAEQEKWDAWDDQRGLSKTEAKRHYISTLIETMHRYASHTTDARELVSELEFVWDQIKTNSPASSSAKSCPQDNGSRPSPNLNESQLIYPVMSEGGARNPGAGASRPMQLMEPMSQHSSDDVQGPYETREEDVEREEFVDAQDSQVDVQDREPPYGRARAPEQTRNFSRDVTALIAPIANYLKRRTVQAKGPEDASIKWQRRIESALIKMNAEMAALREQVEMHQDASTRSSMLRPFAITRRGGGVISWLFRVMLSAASTIAKHIFIDASIIILVALWMRYKGIPAERLEYTVLGWIQQLRQIAYLRRIENKVTMRECNFPVAVAKSLPLQSVGLRPNG